MNRLILLGLLATPMMFSCSNDENICVKPNTSDAISFETYVNKTRADLNITDCNISDFAVYGYTTGSDNKWSTVFNDEEVTGLRSSASRDAAADWSYANVQYWVKGNSYKFHAIAPSVGANWTFDNVTDDAGNIDYTKGKISFTNISDQNDILANGEQDLIYATKSVTGKEYDNPKVSLSFSHLLSRVKFRFRGAYCNPESVSITIKDVRIIDTYDKGDITVSNNVNNAVWSFDNAKKSTLDFGGIDQTFVAETVESCQKYIIPVTDQEVSYTAVVDFQLKARVSDTDNYQTYNVTKQFELTPLQMQAGNSYVYVIDVMTRGADSILEPISFTVDKVEGWSTSDL